MSSGAPLRTTRGTGTEGNEARWLATSRSTASTRGTTNAVTVIRWCCCTARSPTAGTSPAASMPWLAGSGSCCPERRGHGHTADVPGPITVEAMAHGTIAQPLALCRSRRQGQLAVVPGTSPFRLHENPELSTTRTTDFLAADPAPTWMPVRRATPPSAPAAPAAAAQPGHHQPGQRNLPPGLSRPAQRALAAAGYTTLDRLAGGSEADLSQLHGVGPQSIQQLRQALAAAGPPPSR